MAKFKNYILNIIIYFFIILLPVSAIAVIEPEIRAFFYELLYTPFYKVKLDRYTVALQAIVGAVAKYDFFNSEWVLVKEGMISKENDIIRTDHNSSAILEFPERAGFARIFPGTVLPIEELYVLPNEAGEQILRFFLNKGKILTKIRWFNRDKSLLVIKTKAADIFVSGVRTSNKIADNETDLQPEEQEKKDRIAIYEGDKEVIINLNDLMPQLRLGELTIKDRHLIINNPYEVPGDMQNGQVIINTPYENNKKKPKESLDKSIWDAIIDKGVTFLVTSDEKGNTGVVVAEGEVIVKSQGRAIIVKEGETAQISPGESPMQSLIASDSPLLKIDRLSLQDTNLIVYGRTEIGAEVTINGRFLPVNPNGGFSGIIQLEKGVNRLHIVVTAIDGRKKYEDIVVNRLEN